MALLKELAGHPEWEGLLEAAKRMRPDLPAWDSNKDNTDDWKRKSAMQEGFDLALQIFAPHLVKPKP